MRFIAQIKLLVEKNDFGDFSCFKLLSKSIELNTMKTTFRMLIFSLATISIGFTACHKDKVTPSAATAPLITTKPVSGITDVAAISGGNITSDGGSAITVSGICWSTNSTPTVADSKTTDGIKQVGTFSATMAPLSDATAYYVRAYATNAIGTSYGETLSFTTAVTK